MAPRDYPVHVTGVALSSLVQVSVEAFGCAGDLYKCGFLISKESGACSVCWREQPVACFHPCPSLPGLWPREVQVLLLEGALPPPFFQRYF